jgi:hypothetical protein
MKTGIEAFLFAFFLFFLHTFLLNGIFGFLVESILHSICFLCNDIPVAFAIVQEIPHIRGHCNPLKYHVNEKISSQLHKFL